MAPRPRHGSEGRGRVCRARVLLYPERPAHTRVVLDTPTWSLDTIKFRLNGRHTLLMCQKHWNSCVKGRVALFRVCRARIPLRPKRSGVGHTRVLSHPHDR